MSKFADGEVQEMSSVVLASISFAALGLLINQAAQTLPSAPMVFCGRLIVLIVWISSVLITGLSLWRHLRLSRGKAATGADLAVYVIVAVVMGCLTLALVWLAVVMLAFTPAALHTSLAGSSDAPTSCSDASFRAKSFAASPGPERPPLCGRSEA